MDYKLFLKTFFVAFLIFATVVVLGIKYNWVRYLQADSTEQQNENLSDDSSSLPVPIDKKTQSPPKSPSQSTEQYELVDEGVVDQNQTEQIRNDCIRASRRAGVTDENILAVVAQCVEMSTNSMSTTGNADATPVETDDQTIQDAPEADGLELTRKACRIVADEEQGVTAEEREQIVEQCIKANMGNN